MPVAFVVDTVNFVAEHRQLMRKLVSLELGIDPFTQPGLCNLHAVLPKLPEESQVVLEEGAKIIEIS